MELTKTTSILWRNAKLTRPHHSDNVVVITKNDQGFYHIAEVQYSKRFDAFNASDNCDDAEYAFNEEELVAWCYATDITDQFKEELDDE